MADVSAVLQLVTAQCALSVPPGIADFADCAPRKCAAARRLPAAPQAVIVCLFPYRREDESANNVAMSRARFALNEDYHKAIMPLLQRAADALGAVYSAYSFAPFIDDSPIGEVRAAAMAGLGVMGDNGLLLHPLFGSWVHIGCIVTDMPLPAAGVRQPPECAHCGSCRKACPADCLGGDKKSRCLSAVTQKKTLTADDELFIQAQGMVWGCDKCADACPMNAQVVVASHPCLKPYTAASSPDDAVWAWRGGAYARNIALLGGVQDADIVESAEAVAEAQMGTYDMDSDDAWAAAVEAASHRMRNGIGTLGERTLHAVFKHWYSPDEVTHEQKLPCGRVADVLMPLGDKGARVVEVQTSTLRPLKEKIPALLEEGYAVTVAHPIALRRRITWLDADTGELKQGALRRCGRPIHALGELLFLAEYIKHPLLTVELLLLDEEEHRVRCARKSWRGQDFRRVERIPLERPARVILYDVADVAKLLEEVTLPIPFSAADFAKASGMYNRVFYRIQNV